MNNIFSIDRLKPALILETKTARVFAESQTESNNSPSNSKVLNTDKNTTI